MLILVRYECECCGRGGCVAPRDIRLQRWGWEDADTGAVQTYRSKRLSASDAHTCTLPRVHAQRTHTFGATCEEEIASILLQADL